MVTLREVAKEAGVSINTVSVVLNGRAAHGRIAPATAQRVEEAARQLGYQHNTLAKSLRVGKSNSIGVLCHSYPSHHALTTNAASRALVEHGYQVAIQELSWREDQEARLIRELMGQRVDGLLLQSNAHPNINVEQYEAHQVLLNLARNGFPMARLDGDKGLPIDTVMLDREHGAYMATCHFLELGHKRIALTVDKNESVESPRLQERIRGYRKAHKEWGIAIDETLLCGLPSPQNSTNHPAGGYVVANYYLQLPKPPTAIITTNDDVGIGVLCACTQAGLQVPGDMAIIGFTGMPEAEYCAVPLTSVVFPWEAMARETVRLLLERVDGLKQAPRTTTLVPELVIRKSCGANPNYVPEAALSPPASAVS